MKAGKESLRYAIISHLDSMLLAYEGRLGGDARRIVAVRELDPTDEFQMEVGRKWMEGRYDK